jgi:hypothetical protein
MKPSDTDDDRAISRSEIERIVAEELPHWRDACRHAAVENLILNQRAFGDSNHELFLLAVAIKYAGLAKKTVTIGPDMSDPASNARKPILLS